MGALKEARDFYKQKKAEEKLKKKLLSSRSDWHLLEQLIQKENENPNLRVEVRLNDGTVLFLKCYDESLHRRDLINGDYEVVE